MQFSPQTVETDSWRLWLTEGLQLSARRPLAFVTLTLLYAALDYLPAYLSGIQFWLTPLFLGLGCIMAQCADKSTPLVALGRRGMLPVLLRLVLMAALPLLVFLAFRLFAKPEPLPPVIFEGGLGILSMTFLWMLFAGPLLWFLVPLIAAGKLPLGVAAAQSVNATSQNFFVYGLTLAVTFFSALMVGLGASVAAILLYPLLSCVMYVSYRHIWLDRARNEPEPSRVRTGNFATA